MAEESSWFFSTHKKISIAKIQFTSNVYLTSHLGTVLLSMHLCLVQTFVSHGWSQAYTIPHGRLAEI